MGSVVGFAPRAVLACILAAPALASGPSSALTSVDEGFWVNARSRHSCTGLSNLTCRHDATTAAGYRESVPVCVESDPVLGRPLATGCGVVLLSDPDGGFQRTAGLGRRGACVTTRTYSISTRPAVQLYSALLRRTFEVGVDIVNSASSTKISGTLSTADGFTVHVEGHWTSGCSDPTVEGMTEGAWYGTFTIGI